MLIPARTDTKAFHEYIYGKAEIRFVKGRLKFGGSQNSAPFPSMVVVYKNYNGVVTDRDKAISGLERFIADLQPYCGNEADWRRVYDALAVLKEGTEGARV
jgi:site-specific DNA-methyltransferase (adenine-specific)